VRINKSRLLFDSFSLTFYFGSNVDGAAGSNEFFTLFVDGMVSVGFVNGNNCWLDVDEAFELLNIIQINPLSSFFLCIKI